MGFFRKATGMAGKIIGGPAKFILPQSTRTNNDRLFNFSNRVKTVYCPSCGESYLKMYGEKDLPVSMKDGIYSVYTFNEFQQPVYWGCPECSFCFETALLDRDPKDTIVDVKEFIRNSGHESDFIDDDVFLAENAAPIIANQMRNAYIFYGIAVLMSITFFIGAYNKQLFFCITILLFIATFVLNGLRWSYRAWQLHTGNVYSDNPKKQFFDWMSNNNPLKHPNR